MVGRIFVLGSFVVACSVTVSRFPVAGESLRADMLTVEPGGKGFNLAVGAARLGASVDGLMAIGDDLLSSFAAPALSKAGLPLTMLKRLPGATGGGVAFTDATGENCLAVHPGANFLLSAQDVAAAADRIEQAQLVLAQFEIDDAPIAEAFRLARQAGVRTLLNPSPYRSIKPEILANTSILVVNAGEALALAETLSPASRTGSGAITEDELAQAIQQGGPDTLIVTRGPQGAVAFQRDEPPLVQAAFAIEARDSIGAGDAFAAGLSASLVTGLPLSEALRRAAACGALVASRIGVFEALPTAAELQDFLAAHA
ncbi:ribokinase [Bosea sp. BK604]|uniref:ribokinase n=1 Tax=Bosea sp. BK604 TaxID=2512180 RepID=UPI0010501195|nr:ribokinase [Bosea sp. BK604]TCR70058.1 ribokinase [Bosea sp. BK604]